MDVIEEIRAFACDELLKISHGGNEVGGILFGTRREDLIRILTWRPIACDHTQGEGLRLSYNDRMNLAVQFEMARQNPDLKDLRPLGWFVSHASGGVSLSASDLEIYNGFFPEAWQVALAISPQENGHALAGFFVREGDGKIQSDASYLCFDLHPARLAPTATNAITKPIATNPIATNPIVTNAITTNPIVLNPIAANPVQASNQIESKNDEPETEAVPLEQHQAPQPSPTAQPSPTVLAVRTPETIETVAQQAPPLPDPSRAVAAPPPIQPPGVESRRAMRMAEFPNVEPRKAAPPPLEIPTPSFRIDEPLPTHERWLWAIPIVLALGIAAFMLYQRRSPAPNAGIALRAISEAHTVQLAWDANSHAVRDSDRGEIGINDGGKNSQVSLTDDQLHAGKMSYQPQSGDVAFTITVYPASGDPVHDSTRLIAPALNASTEPIQAAPATPVPASPVQPSAQPGPAPQQPELQKEIGRLREDLGKERARADELQNVVRILENRLGIKGSAPKTSRRR